MENCASEQEVEAFFAFSQLFVMTLDNFIDLENVNTDGNHISQAMKPIHMKKIDIKEPLLIFQDLEEHRVVLDDDRLELMEVSNPVKIAYVNAGEQSQSSATYGEYFSLAIGIG